MLKPSGGPPAAPLRAPAPAGWDRLRSAEPGRVDPVRAGVNDGSSKAVKARNRAKSSPGRSRPA